MENELIQTSLRRSGEIKCSICLNEDIEDNILCSTDCSHKFCKICLDKWFDHGKVSCPICRREIKYFNYQGDDNRIVKVVNDNQVNVRLLNYFQVRMKMYRMMVYSSTMLNLYAWYAVYSRENEIDTCIGNYEECLINLTEVTDLNMIYTHYH